MGSNSSSSSPPPLPKSTVRVRVSQITQLLFFYFTIVLINITTTTSIPSPYSQIYPKVCNDVIPSSNPITAIHDADILRSFKFDRGFFAGGEKILGKLPQNGGLSSRLLSFTTHEISKTETDGVSYLESSLTLRNPNSNSGNYRKLLSRFQVRGPKIPLLRRGVSFALYGFWASGSGKLCMVGFGSSKGNDGNVLRHHVVFKLNFPNTSTIVSGLVKGVLESVDSEGDLSYFEPISILGVSEKNYEYTLIEKESENGWVGGLDGKESLSLGFNSSRDICDEFLRKMHSFELEYGGDCDSVHCNPLGEDIGFLPNVMSFDKIRCSKKQRMHLLLGFPNSSSVEDWGPLGVNARTMLVAEGVLDVKKNMFRMIACQISNISESLATAFIGDCSFRLSLRFRSTISIRNRKIVEGQIWSNRSVNDSGYFSRFGFWSNKLGLIGIPGLKYEYTEINTARDLCAKKKKHTYKGSVYPNGQSSDLRFPMSVRNSKGQSALGYISPISVGNLFYSPMYYSGSENYSSLLNISYRLSFKPQSGFKLGRDTLSAQLVEVVAEGEYDTQSGVLCMKGCRHLGSYNKKIAKNVTVDCGIVVNVQYEPLSAKSRYNVKGTIESTRENSDPLYFDRLELSSDSVYTRQAADSIWRMDLEIAMVLISNTLTCVIVGLQLFYVRKHPDVLPFISIVMLLVLTLGLMIPLVLNFEALFLANRTRQNLFLDSGGWLEVNEVIVRVVTMIAFLLQGRLLQQTWSSRLVDESLKSLWVSEKKVLYLSLPLYIGGGLIAWFVNRWKTSYRSPFIRPDHIIHRLYAEPQHSPWGGLKSYGGLILDSFLLPQILFNIFLNSKEKALAPAFYFGITIIRLLPHAYDLYRAHSSSWSFDLSYVYANPKMDLYSTAWDVIIPCAGLLFAVLIYLQQRFGGRFILPKRFRESSEYEKVPVISS